MTVACFKTFHTLNKKKSKSKSKIGKSDEITALLRMTPTIAIGGNIDVVNCIGTMNAVSK